MSLSKKGMRRVIEAHRNLQEREVYVDATIITLQRAIATEPRQVDIECLEECKAVRNEMASPYGMLNNLRRR